MRRKLVALCLAVLAAMAMPGPTAAQTPVPFGVSSFGHRLDGFDRSFVFTVRNRSDFRERLSGRLIVLSVYDLGPSDSLLVPSVEVPAMGEETVEILWPDAPSVGQIRALLVLTDGRGRTVVESYSSWIFPWQMALVLAGAGLVLLGAVLTVVRRAGGQKQTEKKGPEPKKPKKKRRRAPSGMILYAVEYDDTVVNVAERYGVTWEDVVRANRLKPPYELQPGTEILVPKHELKKPPTP